MSDTNSSSPKAGAQPQSLLALVSSNLTGQLSAAKTIKDNLVLYWFIISPTSGLKTKRYHTNGLADSVRIVGDLEVREMLADFLGHLFRGEAHGSYVVGAQ